MDNSTSQVFNSVERKSFLPIDSNGNVFLDDELSTSMELCIGEDDKCVGQLMAMPLTENLIEPHIGMEFNSRDDARDFYVAYGRQTGFTVRIHHNRRPRINNMVIGQDFVCSKEGFRAKKYLQRKDRVLPTPPVTREGCPAMVRVAFKDVAKGVVTKFVKEHNHSLMSPNKVPWRGCGKNLINQVLSLSLSWSNY